MKFSVCSLIIALFVVPCIVASTGWNAAGYKDGETCSMGWSGYLKRLSLIIFMLSGVVLYYVPESRFYFRKGCHDIIDFVADGLQGGLNTTDTEYTVDDSSTYSEQESVETFGKRTSRRSTDIFDEDHVRSAYISDRRNKMDFNAGSSNESLLNREIYLAGPKFERNEYPSHFHLCHRERSLRIEKFSKQGDSTALPFDTVKLYPNETIELEKFSKSKYFCSSERDSDTSGVVSGGLADNRQTKLYPRDGEPIVGNDESFFIADEIFTEEKSVIESEPTVYPEEESIYNATTDREDAKSYRHFGEKIDKHSDRPTRVDKKLLELNRTLRSVRSSFSRKYSTNILDKEEYAVRIIEAILQTVKRSFEEVEESEKNESQKRYRKSKCARKISASPKAKKSRSSNYQDQNLPLGAPEDHYHYRGSDLIPSSNRKLRTPLQNNAYENSRRRYSSYFAMPGDDMDVPIFTNSVKPMIERAARWFFGRCPSMKCQTPVVGNEGIVENNLDEATA